MIAALKKTNKSNSEKRVEGREAVSSREYDSLHFYDHTSTCIPFVNFVFYSCLKIWGGCSFSKTTYVQTQSKDFHLFSSTKLQQVLDYRDLGYHDPCNTGIDKFLAIP